MYKYPIHLAASTVIPSHWLLSSALERSISIKLAIVAKVNDLVIFVGRTSYRRYFYIIPILLLAPFTKRQNVLIRHAYSCGSSSAIWLRSLNQVKIYEYDNSMDSQSTIGDCMTCKMLVFIFLGRTHS